MTDRKRRVVTPFGLGTTRQLHETGTISVELDELYQGDYLIELNKIGEVFPFSHLATIRVLNISGAGWFSNLQFHFSAENAGREYNRQSPPDETTFFLDIKNGKCLINRELGLPARDYIGLYPWIDRWAIERTELYTNTANAVNTFADHRERLAGATGISSAVLLDVQSRRVLWFYIAINSPQGVIFEKKFLSSV